MTIGRLRVLACAAATIATPASAVVTFNTVATGFTQATAVTQNARAGDTRMFVASKEGLVRYLDRATGTRTTLLDLRGEVATSGEQGLIGLAFDPNYATNGHYFVHMNVQPDPAGPVLSEIRRYTDPSVATGAPLSIIRVPQPATDNHKGGWIGFDGTGNLMIALGDGGGVNDPAGTGQNPSDLLGSILRIDVRGATAAAPYAIPAGNASITDAAREVFAYGVRNPFGNSVAPDGNLIVADVGQFAREEITVVGLDTVNRNLGWRLREGDIATPGVGGPEPADHLAPGYSYDHLDGDRSIIGGFVYRGSTVSELFGRYVFGDQVSGRLWSIAYAGGVFDPASRIELGVLGGISALGETPDGEILVTQFDYGPAATIIQLGTDSPVPEPASWATMLTGFALAGAALRRGRNADGRRARLT